MEHTDQGDAKLNQQHSQSSHSAILSELEEYLRDTLKGDWKSRFSIESDLQASYLRYIVALEEVMAFHVRASNHNADKARRYDLNRFTKSSSADIVSKLALASRTWQKSAALLEERIKSLTLFYMTKSFPSAARSEISAKDLDIQWLSPAGQESITGRIHRDLCWPKYETPKGLLANMSSWAIERSGRISRKQLLKLEDNALKVLLRFGLLCAPYR